MRVRHLGSLFDVTVPPGVEENHTFHTNLPAIPTVDAEAEPAPAPEAEEEAVLAVPDGPVVAATAMSDAADEAISPRPRLLRLGEN